MDDDENADDVNNDKEIENGSLPGVIEQGSAENKEFGKGTKILFAFLKNDHFEHISMLRNAIYFLFILSNSFGTPSSTFSTIMLSRENCTRNVHGPLYSFNSSQFVSSQSSPARMYKLRIFNQRMRSEVLRYWNERRKW